MTHWHLENEQPVEIINFIDDYSRAVLASVAVPVATAAEVVRIFFETAAMYGFPASVLSDNGAIYTCAYRGSHTGMEIELATLGITFKHGKPYHPQTQGKVERYHLTLKKWLAKKPPVATLVELQAQIDRFVHIYNEERPHTARGCPPMQAWRALDKATVELDGQPPLAHTKVRRDRSRLDRMLHPALPLQAPPRQRRTRTQGQASADLDGRPRRPGHRRGRRHDPTPRAGPLGQLPGQVTRYLLRVHVSQKYRDITRVKVKVKVKGLEPSASTLRTSGSRCLV